MRLLPVALLLTLPIMGAVAGCAPGVDRRAYLASLVGQPEAEVVRQLGVPSRAYETGGRKFIAYTEQRTDVLPLGGFYGGGLGFWGAGYGYFGGFAPQVIERRCETTFEIAEGRVLSWALRGNVCP